MSHPRHSPPGPLCSATLSLELREVGGPVLLTRRARNTVARSGAELLAGLFVGGGAKSINAVALGIGEEPNGPPYEVTGLTVARPGGEPLLTSSVVPIDPAGFEVTTLADELRVRVSLRTLIPANKAVHRDAAVDAVDIAEASLGVSNPAGDALSQIYNRVVFEPFPKARKHEISLYWEISFPYGPNA